MKIPSTTIPEPIIQGIRGWKTASGVTILRLHYTADPDRCTPEWLEMQVEGYVGGMEGRDWRREMEIDFSSYAGLPVFSQFDAADSVRPVKYNPQLPLLRGWDFGYRHPAVTWHQYWEHDNVFVTLDELYPTLDPTAVPGITTGDLAQLVIERTRRRFPLAYDEDGPGIMDFGDPAGTQAHSTSELTDIEILSQYEITCQWRRMRPANRAKLLRPYIEQKGRYRIDPSCVLTIEALSGGYRYPEEGKGGRDLEKPDDGAKAQQEPYIHLMDSMGYVATLILYIDYKSVSNPWDKPELDSPETQLSSSLIDMTASWYRNREDVPEEVEHDELRDILSNVHLDPWS